MSIITISRGSMSGGQALAERVAGKLGLPIVGREIIVEAASGLGVSREFLGEKLDKAPGFWERLTQERHNYVLAVQTALAEYAAKGALLYHGQAGHLLLKGLPGILRVRLIAPFDMRVRSLMQQRGFSRADAEHYIRQVDEGRVRWTRAMYGVDLLDPANYDLVINLDTTTLETACAVVEGVARRPEFVVTDAVRAKLRDFAAQCRQKLEAARAASGIQAPALPFCVLVVDDEPDFATALVEQLMKRGYAARSVFSGADAVGQARSQVFDVVVLDLKMPQADGLETLRRLHDLDPALRVVILSGHGTVDWGIEGMRLGASDFLLKPVDLKTLCASIDAAAEASREQRRPGPD